MLTVAAGLFLGVVVSAIRIYGVWRGNSVEDFEASEVLLYPVGGAAIGFLIALTIGALKVWTPLWYIPMDW